jgi:hypothetical protein
MLAEPLASLIRKSRAALRLTRCEFYQWLEFVNSDDRSTQFIHDFSRFILNDMLVVEGDSQQTPSGPSIKPLAKVRSFPSGKRIQSSRLRDYLRDTFLKGRNPDYYSVPTKDSRLPLRATGTTVSMSMMQLRQRNFAERM